MDAARLPEIHDLGDGSIVRCFLVADAIAFRSRPAAERRATPAVIRRLFVAAAAKHAEEAADCLVCGKSTSLAGRTLIAVETADGHDIGSLCQDCLE